MSPLPNRAQAAASHTRRSVANACAAVGVFIPLSATRRVPVRSSAYIQASPCCVIPPPDRPEVALLVEEVYGLAARLEDLPSGFSPTADAENVSTERRELR